MRWSLPLIFLAIACPLWANEPLPNPLTLEAALEFADNTHPEIQLRLVELEKTRAQGLQVAGGDDLDVRLKLFPNYVIPPEIAPQDRNDSQAHFSVSKRLYDFGQTSNLVEAAELSTQAKELFYQDARNRMRLSIIQRYFNVLISDIEFSVQNEDMAVAYITMDRARDEHALGKKSDVDLMELESAYQEIRLKRYRAETLQRATRSLLAQALNRPQDLPSDLELPGLEGNERPLPEYETLVDMALANNLKMKALSIEIDAARHRMDASRSKNYPVLSGEVLASYYNREFGSRNPFTAGLLLDIPIYTGERVDADVAAEQADFMRYQAELKAEEFNIRQDILTAWQTIQTLQAQREQADTQTDFRELYLDRSRTLYEMEARADLGDAMVRQTEARLLTLRTEFELALAWAQLEVLTGQPPMETNLLTADAN
jgi:outer membrane protein TolC